MIYSSELRSVSGKDDRSERAVPFLEQPNVTLGATSSSVDSIDFERAGVNVVRIPVKAAIDIVVIPVHFGK